MVVAIKDCQSTIFDGQGVFDFLDVPAQVYMACYYALSEAMNSGGLGCTWERPPADGTGFVSKALFGGYRSLSSHCQLYPALDLSTTCYNLLVLLVIGLLTCITYCLCSWTQLSPIKASQEPERPMFGPLQGVVPPLNLVRFAAPPKGSGWPTKANGLHMTSFFDGPWRSSWIRAAFSLSRLPAEHVSIFGAFGHHHWWRRPHSNLKCEILTETHVVAMASPWLATTSKEWTTKQHFHSEPW